MEQRNKINVLFLIDMFNGPKDGPEKHVSGGTERHLYALAVGLDRDKFNCIVCFFEGNNVLADLLEKESIPAIALQLKKLYQLKALATALKLARIIKKNRIDIVQTYHFKSDTYGVFISRLSGVEKIISSRRDTGDLKTPRQLLLNKMMNRFIDSFIVVCNKVGASLARSEGIDFKKMTTIYNGVDLKRFSSTASLATDHLKTELGIKKDAFVLGSAALFRPEKGYDVLLDGIKRLAPHLQNWKVLLIGDGPSYEQCKEYCRTNNLDGIVIFAGYVENVEAYLKAMDVFCLIPKNNEGFSNAVLEAMAMGKPVIATDVGGNNEAVIDGETGLIIPAGNPQIFTEAVMTLYKDPVKRTKMGQKARERAEEYFSHEKMITEHEKFYQKILQSI